MTKELLLAAAELALFAAFLVGMEFFSARDKWSPELTRRITHFAGCMFAIILFLSLPAPIPLYIHILFLLFFFVSRRTKTFNHIHKVTRKTYGEEMLALGFIAAYFVAHGSAGIFIPTLLIIGIADPLTGFIMQKTKNHVLGFLGFFIVSFTILYFATSLSFVSLIDVAALAAIVERVSTYGADNLTVPLAASLLLSLLK